MFRDLNNEDHVGPGFSSRRFKHQEITVGLGSSLPVAFGIVWLARLCSVLAWPLPAVLNADHPCDDAGGRRPAGADRAGPAARTDPAGAERDRADHASHAADHHQHRRDPADPGKASYHWKRVTL